MASKVGDIELYVGPREVGGPDDLRKAIRNTCHKMSICWIVP